MLVVQLGAGGVHVTAVPVQAPLPSHLSLVVHLSLSSHAVPISIGAYVQTPVFEAQVPVDAVQPPMGGVVHETAAPFTQTPLEHVAMPLHRSPSSQLIPSATAVCDTVPVVESQASTVHGSLSSMAFSAPGVHPPLPSQTSFVVQSSPSSQVVPCALFGYVHFPRLHVPAASKQVGGVEQLVEQGGAQAGIDGSQPFGQFVACCVYAHPTPGVQLPAASNVARVVASEQNAAGGVTHVVGVSPAHVPVASHLSLVVHGSPSSQAVPVLSIL